MSCRRLLTKSLSHGQPAYEQLGSKLCKHIGTAFGIGDDGGNVGFAIPFRTVGDEGADDRHTGAVERALEGFYASTGLKGVVDAARAERQLEPGDPCSAKRVDDLVPEGSRIVRPQARTSSKLERPQKEGW